MGIAQVKKKIAFNGGDPLGG